MIPGQLSGHKLPPLKTGTGGPPTVDPDDSVGKWGTWIASAPANRAVPRASTDTDGIAPGDWPPSDFHQ